MKKPRNGTEEIIDHLEEDLDPEENSFEIEELYKKKKSYYEILGVKRNATQKEITEAFRKKSRKCHPDAQRLTSEQQKIFKPKELEEYFEEKQKQLNEAYEVLSNERKRAQYDVLGKCITSLVLADDSENISFQELKERYKDYKREQRRQLRDSKTQGSTSANLSMDISGSFLSEQDLEDAYIEQDGQTYRVIIPKVSFTNSSFSQTFHTPISKLDTLIFHGNANCDQLSAENISHTIALQWRHVIDPTKEATQFDLVTAFSTQNPNALTLVASGSTKLSDYSFGSMKWVGQFNGISPTFMNWLSIAGFQLVYKRQLFSDPSLFGSIHFSFPQDNNVSLVVDKNFEHDGSSLSTELRLSPTNSHISCEFRRNVPEWIRALGRLGVSKKQDSTPGGVEMVTDVTLSTPSLGFQSDSYDVGMNMMLVKTIGEETELGFGVGASKEEGISLKFSLKRADRHHFTLPIVLSHYFHWKMLFMATITPITCYTLIQNFILDPLMNYWRRKETRSKRKEAYLSTQHKRQVALQELDKIREQALQSRNAEEEVNGLIIINAKYGDLEDVGDDVNEYPSWIDLTDQLQFLVSNSKLYLPEYSKSRMEGSFDPAPNIPKTLLVWYRFRGKTHRVEIDDEEELRIPLEEDVVRNDDREEMKVMNGGFGGGVGGVGGSGITTAKHSSTQGASNSDSDEEEDDEEDDE
ncbi:hypothetical protein C9374_009632 [Naegleria lovaniensis]|uniref:J domain-containing protein n=1 Tax=Naegleria lovaniensis TaxID=51637 RepID=A0AA88KX56_NAELO|nr:uncharacterized protein C9374_009632 [Naegleria lovaniensis]KAG2393055.1 hypothetical protein C9374_009632 [Naegleria lovaniensis]